MSSHRPSLIIQGCLIFLLVLAFTTRVSAQDSREYYPLHIGDYWIQYTDSLEGQPGFMRTDIEGSDIIREQSYFRMKQQLTDKATGEEQATWYLWMRQDTAGIVIGAFGETAQINEMVIATQTILVDGNPSDWNGITALAVDPQGDDLPSYSGDDIKALYIARDANHLYVRLDLWENVNISFQNSSPPYDGSYCIFIDNDGPFHNMKLGIAYDSYAGLWSLGYNYSSYNAPTGLEGPSYVGVNGNIIELKIPLNLIGNPSRYSQIKAEVLLQYGFACDELEVRTTAIYDPPIRWIHKDMLDAGFTWEFEAPELGGQHWITLESDSETVQVLAGTFYDCAKLRQIVVSSEGDTVQNLAVYYARGVGEVLRNGWAEWIGRMDFQLIEYSIQAIQVEHVNPPQAGQSVMLTIAVPSERFQPTIKRLYYRTAGSASWEYLTITEPGTNFDVAIPQSAVTLRGIEYYVYLSDGQQELTYPSIDPISKPAAIQAKINNYTLPLTLPRITYQMISVPLELSYPQIQQVLGDDYGSYDSERWRLFRWEDGAYVEYPNLKTNFAPGTAFWLVTRNGESFDVDIGLSTSTSQPFSVTLQPGWNQIANPFAFPILTDIVDVPDNTLELPVYYDGTDYQYDVTTLQPWEGYFVYNKTSMPVTILMPPIAAQDGGTKLSKCLTINPDREYLLQLSATMQNTKLMDTQNFIGLRERASYSRDNLDLAEAPPIGEHIQLSIIENEERFAANFKPAQSSGHCWNIELSASPMMKLPIHIDLHEMGHLPEGQQLYILDQDYDCAIPTTDNKFSAKLSRSMPVRHFKILIGTKAYAEQHSHGISLIPLNFALGSNYPNPFNPETTIPYQVGRRSLVSLEILNVLGQRIRTLVAGEQNTGQYAVSWDGTDDAGKSVATGVYMCRFHAGEFVATQKLLLVR